jgi:SAM-dependent methyltransferase
MRAKTILEVGCGTGEITEELAGRTKALITAVDIDPSMVERTRERVPSAEVITADAASLDFRDGSFDAAVCHFTLMWCSEPGSVISEMARVVGSSGCVVALSEPDYGGALEYPHLSGYAQLVAEGLRRRSADPEIGRKLGCFFSQVQLETDIGLASAIWTEKEMLAGIDACMWLVRDVVAEGELAEMENAYAAALSAGGFAFFLPVFWAFGLKK